MEIFYINIENFKKKHSRKILETYSDRIFKMDKRFYEYTIGRYLIKNIAHKIFDVCDTEIIYDNNKPKFKNSTLNFNISHSKNIVIACFDKCPCSIDIEYIKTRNLIALSKYFERKFYSLDEFYKFWTIKEAAYKLQENVVKSYSLKFQKYYYLTIASNHHFDESTIQIHNANTFLITK